MTTNAQGGRMEKPEPTDDEIMRAVINECDALDITRAHEMRGGSGWHATTIFDGDAALLRVVKKAMMLTTPAAEAVAGGMRWVPVEPTEEMIGEGMNCGIHWYPEMSDGDVRDLVVLVYRAMLAALPASPADTGETRRCGQCHKCLEGQTVSMGAFAVPITATRMVVCETCGNKRCPHATDCELACTGSNESGQPGSVYATARAAVTAEDSDFTDESSGPAAAAPERHERRVVGHASGWQEQMNTCVCGEPWPCKLAFPPPAAPALPGEDESAGDMHARLGMDGKLWAQEFVKLHGGDEGLMLAWFCNAIMAGFDEASRRALSSSAKAAREKTVEECADMVSATRAIDGANHDQLVALAQRMRALTERNP